MATATVTTDLTEVTDCDSTTAGGVWSDVSAVLGTSDPDPLEGTGWVGGILKKDGDGMMFTPTSPIDMSGTHLRWPFISILKPNLLPQDSGGITLTIIGSTSGTAVFNLSGTDKYIGGWEVLVVNPYATPDSGTPVVGNVVSIHFEVAIGTSAKNVVTTQHDWISYGTGLKAYGGSNGDEIAFSHINTQDEYYLLSKLKSGVYRLTGKIQLGDDDSTNDCYFEDSGQILIFEDLAVDSTLYELKVVGNATGTTVVDLSGNFITTVAPNYIITMIDDTNVDSIILDGTIIQKAGDVFLSSVVSGDGTVFDQCGMLEPDDATMTNFSVKNGTETDHLLFPSGTNNLSNAQFISAGTGHAILIEDTGTITFDNFKFTGYASGDGSTGNECVYNNSGGLVTINITNGGDTPTIHNGTSATTIVNNAVDLTITVKNTAGTELENVRVQLEADSGGAAPFEESVTIAGSGTTATVTHGTHGLASGNTVLIKGANEFYYNGRYVITVTDSSTYTYTMAGSPSTPATGTITCTQAFMSELTNSSGIATESFNYAGSQPYVGKARLSTAPPYYADATFTGSIGASGIDLPVQLVSD